MMKIVMILALCLAAVLAAPQILLSSSGHLPYSNGWTDGPNNGVGPVISYIPSLGYSALGSHLVVV